MRDIRAGKFGPLVLEQISRWEIRLTEPLVYSDVKHGPVWVKTGFISDQASIRVLREVCRYGGLLALLGGPLSKFWFVVAFLALAIYGLLAGYGKWASVVHDAAYSNELYRGRLEAGSITLLDERIDLTRSEADEMLVRACHHGEGQASWRAFLFNGVRPFGWLHWRK